MGNLWNRKSPTILESAYKELSPREQSLLFGIPKEVGNIRSTKGMLKKLLQCCSARIKSQMEMILDLIEKHDPGSKLLDDPNQAKKFCTSQLPIRIKNFENYVRDIKKNFKKAKDDLDASKTELEELNNLKEEINKLISSKKKYKTKAEDLKKELEDLKMKNEEYIKQFKDSDQEKQNLIREGGNLKKEIDDLSKEAEGLKKANEDFKSIIEKLKEKSNLDQKTMKKNLESKRKLMKRNSQLRDKVAVLKHHLKSNSVSSNTGGSNISHLNMILDQLHQNESNSENIKIKETTSHLVLSDISDIREDEDSISGGNSEGSLE